MAKGDVEEPLGTLFSRLVDDAKGVARAEIALYRRATIARLKPAVAPLLLALMALVIVIAATTALFVGVALWLAQWIGALCGGIAALLIGLILAAIFGSIAMRKLRRGLPR